MDRKGVVGLVLCTAALASLATPLYEPLAIGADRTWLLLLLTGGAAVGTGALVGRAWVLLLAVLAPVVGFVASGAEGLSWLLLIFGLPFALACTGVGLALARWGPAGTSIPVAVFCFCVAIVPVGVAAGKQVHRASLERVPAHVEARLPTEPVLDQLCGGRLRPRERSRLRRKARALSAALEARPDQLVRSLVPYADQPQAREDRTVEELAEEQLSGTDGCRDPAIRRLREQTGRD